MAKQNYTGKSLEDLLPERQKQVRAMLRKEFAAFFTQMTSNTATWPRISDQELRACARHDGDAVKIVLLSSFDAASRGEPDIPDPYYGDEPMFDAVLGMIERACRALFRQLEPAVRHSA